MKLKKRRKSSRPDKTGRHGSRKKHRGSGSRGGVGLAGTGKRAGHKITSISPKTYFGKKRKISDKKKIKKKTKFINLKGIQRLIEKKGKRELDLKDYKILGEGEIKEKVIIKAKAASKSAEKKIKEAGGEIILYKKDENKKEK